MDKQRKSKHPKTNAYATIVSSSSEGMCIYFHPSPKHVRCPINFTLESFGWWHETEVSSLEWEAVNMNQEEEDLICRMHKLVGNRFDHLN